MSANEPNATEPNHEAEAERYLEALMTAKLAQEIARPCELCEAAVIKNEFGRFKISHERECPNHE